MKKNLKVISIFVVLILLISNIVFATESEVVNQYDEAEITDEYGIMPISSNINDEDLMNSNLGNYETSDIWKMENHTDITDLLYGDLYIMSNSVEVGSELIEGNAFIMADRVKISGNIYGSVFIMANSVEISGKIQDAYILANNVNITETGEVSRNVKVGANTFDLKGMIYRNLSVVANNINIVGNPLGANVFGDLSYSGKLNSSENQVSGEIKEIDIPKAEINKTTVIVSVVKDFAISILTALLVIALIVYFTNSRYENKDIKVSDYLKDIGFGFLYLIMIPAVAILLMITVIGFPIGVFGLLLYFIVLYLAIPVASIEISKLVLKENNSKVKVIFTALLVCAILKLMKFLPVIGDIIRFLAILYGIRVIIKAILNKKSNKSEEIDEKQ